MKPRLYDLNMNRIGTIRHATRIGYKHVLNDLWTASFSLPVMDEAAELCENLHYIVDIFDGDRSAGKYRLSDEPEEEMTSEGAMLSYSCEHVLAFLFDDRIDGYLEIGGTGVYTEDVIEHLLSLQTVRRWKLGRCDFHYQFQYGWENEDILNALFAIPKCFADEYRWTYETSSYPWTINLVRRDTERGCEIRYRRNEKSIKRSKDVSRFCTRLYCLGSGEGVNQTSIRTANPTGKSYIDSPNIGRYGVVSKLLTDKSISDEATLFAKGQAYLKLLENPQYSYTVKALDLHRMTGIEMDRIDEGKLVRVVDERLHQDFDRYVVSFEKEDVDADPLGADVVIASESEDVSSAIEDISAKAAITAQYAQGATNLFPMQVTDNADEEHPAKFRFWIPQSCVKINSVLLSWSFARFRAYEKGAQAGGGEVSTTLEGGASTQTSESGGATTVTSDAKVVTTAASTGSPMGGDGVSATYTESAGGHSHDVNSHRHSVEGHTHNMNNHKHASSSSGPNPAVTVSNGSGNTGYSSPGTSTSGEHTHRFSHWHQVTVTMDIPGFSVNIPSHTHNVSIPSHTHTFTIPDHVHDIEYGIFEGGTASGVAITVDGTSIPADKIDGVREIDVIPYMGKNSDGRITRGTWHEIRITPNALTRIEAFLFVQTFVTSYAGGTY